MTAYSHTLTPSNTILICSGNAEVRLAQVEALLQDSYQITSWASHSQTPLDGDYLIGVSLTKNELNCPTLISTQPQVSVQQSLKQFEKNVASLGWSRWQPSEPKEQNQQSSQPAEDIVAKTIQMELTQTLRNICHHLSLKNEDSCGQSATSLMETPIKIENRLQHLSERLTNTLDY